MPNFMQTGLLITSALATIGGGAWAIQGEYAAFSMNVPSQAVQYDGIMSLSAMPPSITSQRDVALMCGTLLYSFYPATRGDGGQSALQQQCRKLVADSAKGNGADPLGWSTLARTYGLAGDYAAMNDALMKSFATGPNEQWLSVNRFVTAEKFWAELTPETRANHETDIRLMLTSLRAIDTLVLNYLASPDFAERLVTIVQTMPDNVQRRFVSHVRRVSQQLTGGNS